MIRMPTPMRPRHTPLIRLTRLIGPIALVTTLTLSCQAMAAGATGIELFATQAQLDAEVSLPPNVKTYAIDGLARFEQTLSKGLPNDVTQATEIAAKTLRDLSTEERQALQHHAEGHVKQQQYRLDRYPAIVFDGQAIVYGTTDIGHARRHYQRWQENP